MMNAHSTNASLAARLREVESRNITWTSEGWPIFWERASGAEVRDVEGRRFIDFTSAFGVAALGHSHPEVTSAVTAQLATLAHGMGDVHPSRVKVELLERLADLFGRPARAILSLSGTEAVESALKTARIATGRSGILAFEGAYHGLGYGALAATWRADFRDPFAGQVPEIATHLPFPTPSSVDAVLAEAARHLATGRFGAVIIEPIQGRAGIRPTPPGFLPALKRLAAEHGALFILDEVMTGFGRTGRLFAWMDEDVRPDVLAVGKALGNGVPISAAIGRAEVMDAWPETTGDAIHTSTFLGHPLGCRAALAVLEVMTRDDVPRVAGEKGAFLAARLRGSITRLGVSWTVRGRGLMLGIDCGSAAIAGGVMRRSLEKGLLILADGIDHGTIVLLPPLTIADDLLREGLGILEDVLAELARG